MFANRGGHFVLCFHRWQKTTNGDIINRLIKKQIGGHKIQVMTKKDLTNNENIDHNKRAAKDWENHHDLSDRFPEEAKGIGETEVKNAHASGDGSLERNDEGLPDTSKDENKKNEQDPPY